MPDSGASRYKKNSVVRKMLGAGRIRDTNTVPFSLVDFDKVSDIRLRLVTVEQK